MREEIIYKSGREIVNDRIKTEFKYIRETIRLIAVYIRLMVLGG